MRTRKEQRNIKKSEYDVLASKIPREHASRVFKRKAYELHDVRSYMAKKCLKQDEGECR